MMGSEPEGAAEGTATIKAGCGVVVHEDVAEAAIGKDGATKFCNIGGRH